jgi:hypothetical protein
VKIDFPNSDRKGGTPDNTGADVGFDGGGNMIDFDDF